MNFLLLFFNWTLNNQLFNDSVIILSLSWSYQPRNNTFRPLKQRRTFLLLRRLLFDRIHDCWLDRLILNLHRLAVQYFDITDLFLLRFWALILLIVGKSYPAMHVSGLRLSVKRIFSLRFLYRLALSWIKGQKIRLRSTNY